MEFALVLPLLLVVLVGMVQMGAVLRDHLVVLAAAREAAREAAVSPDDALVAAAAARIAPCGAAADVSIGRSGGQGEPVTVSVRCRQPLAVPLVSWLLPAAVSLEGVATFRQEFAPSGWPP